jgi:hypothetical protein
MLQTQPNRSLWDPTLQVCVPYAVELQLLLTVLPLRLLQGCHLVWSATHSQPIKGLLNSLIQVCVSVLKR